MNHEVKLILSDDNGEYATFWGEPGSLKDSALDAAERAKNGYDNPSGLFFLNGEVIGDLINGEVFIDF